MNDNYLWDRTGAPDPEIQKLEEILGVLRYQPQSLPIPADSSIERRRSLFPAMVIAAAIAMMAVILGLWVRSRQSQMNPVDASTRRDTRELPSALPAQNSDQNSELTDRHDRKPSGPTIVARRTQPVRTQPKTKMLTEEEQAQKEEVVAALRFISAKLNVAQRKTQGVTVNNIRNQHRIG